MSKASNDAAKRKIVQQRNSFLSPNTSVAPVKKKGMRHSVMDVLLTSNKENNSRQGLPNFARTSKSTPQTSFIKKKKKSSKSRSKSKEARPKVEEYDNLWLKQVTIKRNTLLKLKEDTHRQRYEEKVAKIEEI